MRWWWGCAALMGAASSAGGCEEERYAGLCEKAQQCSGYNDADYHTCVERFEACQEIHEIAECADQYDKFIHCFEAHNECIDCAPTLEYCYASPMGDPTATEKILTPTNDCAVEEGGLRGCANLGECLGDTN